MKNTHTYTFILSPYQMSLSVQYIQGLLQHARQLLVGSERECKIVLIRKR